MWTESGVAWDFSVQPAFYQTWWFVGGCALLVLPVIWGAWWLRMRQIQHRFSLVLSERARISREIHDTLLQSLVGVALQFEGLSRRVGPSSPSLKEHLVRIRVQVEEYIREARRSISNLRSAVLEQRDLVSAITDTGQQITAGKPMQFTVEVSGTPKRCGPSVEEQALRMGREALYNAVLHANARHISVHFHYTRRSLLIKVVDDGEGFDGRQLDGHYGLASMRERASQAGATLTIDTGIGTGTQVEMVFPMVGRS